MRLTRVLLPFSTLAVAMLVAAVLAAPSWAEEDAPSVPHAVAGRVDCLGCHGKSVELGEGHEGRTGDSCTLCHKVRDVAAIPALAHPAKGQEKCLQCHATGSPKPVPADHPFVTNQACLTCHPEGEGVGAVAAPVPGVSHPVEGREDCLRCHGSAEPWPVPPDHAGRSPEICQECHQVSGSVTAPASPQAIATPISEPQLFADNSCVTCHLGLEGTSAANTLDWQASVHASEGVGCVSCHGGDPGQAEASAAMSTEAGFLGPLAKAQTPSLCASCHSDVDLMRPYNIATDQFGQYWQSQHGEALLAGDDNVATCYDCHGGHKVLKVDDPAATVYPTNEPAMCASCHADEESMAAYGIPTDPYGLYQGSVHGTAVLERQDLRAPTCSTCHGVHGAAPPGFEQVAAVCGQCHSATQDYYQKGAHKAGLTQQGGPGCVTCHGQHDVKPPTLDLLRGGEDGHCGACHAAGTPAGAQADEIYQALAGADDAYAEAEATIAEARAARLIVVQQEEVLQKANTPLIEARAVQHTVSVSDVEARTQESVELSRQAQASAEAALREIGTRRIGMGVALAVILLVIVALVLIKRDLDHKLEAERAKAKAGSPGPRSG